MLTAKIVAGANLLAVTLINNDSAISVGCAVAIVAAVWSAGRRLKGWEDKIDAIKASTDEHTKGMAEHSRRIGDLERQIFNLSNERHVDIDMMRGELSGAEYQPNQRYNILIVDDECADQMIMRRRLSKWFNVDISSTLKGAMEKLKEKDYHCVVVDLGLPDSIPSETISELIGAHPAAVCVAISGSGDPNLIARAVAAGADSYVMKGGNDERYLPRQIMHAITRKTMRQQNP